MDRNQLIAAILENMTLTKRGMVSHFQTILHELPVSGTQVELLHIINQHQPMSSKALAEERQLTRGAVSQLTEALESAALITRHPDEHDRRLQLLKTTKRGDELLETVHKRRDELFKKVMVNFSDQELATWQTIQRKIIDELESQKNTTS